MVKPLSSGILIVLVLGMFAPTSRADTFNFAISLNPQCGTPEFQAIWGICNPIEASGVLTTTSVIIPADATDDAPPCIGNGNSFRGTAYYEILNMTGQINGNAISFTPHDPQACMGQLTNPGPGDHENIDYISFTAGNQDWNLTPACDFAVCTNFGIFNLITGQNNFIQISTISTPEPETLLLLGVGITTLLILRPRRDFGPARSTSSS